MDFFYPLPDKRRADCAQSALKIQMGDRVQTLSEKCSRLPGGAMPRKAQMALRPCLSAGLPVWVMYFCHW